MNSKRINDVIQTITGLAILAGLALVVWELQQNREATMSQLSSDGYQLGAQVELLTLGEEPGQALAKACFEPHDLSSADLFVLDALYSQRITNIDRLIALSERGSFYDNQFWRMYAEMQFSHIFRSQVGRNYWQSFRLTRRSEIVEYGDELLSKSPPPNCKNLYGGWQQLNFSPVGEQQ